MRIGICGIGTVGAGVFNLVAENQAEIERKIGSLISIEQIGCRKDHPDVHPGSTKVTRDIFEVANNPEVDIVIELIGGTDIALELVKTAIANGKHVVTANKALIAMHGDEIFALASDAGVQVRFEAAIAGGIPIVKVIREGLAANRISWLAGIINGTSNFILTEMEQPGSNLTFSDVLTRAQELGYAEADPTFDIEGIDAAHKLTLLSAIAFGVPLQFDKMYTEGISHITTEDIRYAHELGYKIRHLGITRHLESGIELRVHPALIRDDEMLAQVNGVMNAVMVGSDAAGATMYYGAGAGGKPTASAVVADVIDIIRTQGASMVANLGYVADKVQMLPVLAMKDLVCACYMKLDVMDQPGVMAKLTTILSDNKISIEALIQKDAAGGSAAIVVITDEVKESAIDAAIVQIEKLEQVHGSVKRIRIAEL